MAANFHKLYDEVASNVSIPASALKLYNFLLSKSNINTGETPPMYIIHLAEIFGRSERTIQLWLAELIKRGLIARVFRKDKNNPKHNQSSYFIIVHSKAHLQDNERPSGNIVKFVNTSAAKSFVEHDTKNFTRSETGFHPQIESLREIQNLTLKRGTEDTPGDADGVYETSEDLIQMIDDTTEELDADTPEKTNPIDNACDCESSCVSETVCAETPKAEKQNPVDNAFDWEKSNLPPKVSAEIQKAINSLGAAIAKKEAQEAAKTQGTPKEKDTNTVNKACNSDLENVPETVCNEAPAPKTEAKETNLVNKTGVYDASKVPEAMRVVVDYMLLKTGRPTLTEHEYTIVRELDAKHTPARVLKEIEKQVEIKLRKGLNVRQVTFNLIGAILRNQESRGKAKTAYKAAKTAVETTQTPQQAREPLPEVAAQILPADEAEKIISEYVPAKKKDDGIPVALQELLEGIKKRHRELGNAYLCKHTEYWDSLDPECLAELKSMNIEDNNPYADVDDSDLEFKLEDYLRLKFPEATEEELRTDKVQDKRGLQKAFDMDYTCALCEAPEMCPYKGESGRPMVTMEKNARGDKYLEVRYTVGRIPCKNNVNFKDKSDSEFEQRLKHSGLSERQTKQTFEQFDHVGAKPEVLSAKAKAILAAKNKTSLVLAGKAGTGKTHLAVSIALEVMKGGQRAIFRTVSELLDELFRAEWEHTDFFYIRQKYYDVPCLVLDDLGKEKLTPKKLEYLYQIIDYRYRQGRQTIITTNALDMNGLVNDVNANAVEPLVSRLLENGEWVTIRDAGNYRLKPELQDKKPEEMKPAAPIKTETPKSKEQKCEEPIKPKSPKPEEPKTKDWYEDRYERVRKSGGIIITVPEHNDGLDWDEGDIKL